MSLFSICARSTIFAIKLSSSALFAKTRGFFFASASSSEYSVLCLSSIRVASPIWPVSRIFLICSLCSVAFCLVGGKNGDCSTKGPYGQYFNSQQGLQTCVDRSFHESRKSLSDMSISYPRASFTDECIFCCLVVMIFLLFLILIYAPTQGSVSLRPLTYLGDA